MKVLVLGASGFVGRHVLPALLAQRHHVVALSRTPSVKHERVTWLERDALESDSVEKALEGCQAAVNLIGINHERGGQTYARMHVEVTRRLVEEAQRRSIERIIQVSVLCARPDPTSPYHDTKHQADELVRRAKVPWVILRPAIIFGPDDAFTTTLSRQVDGRVTPLPAGGKAIHAPVHVDDVAEAVTHALVLPSAIGKILPLCGARTLSYRELVREIAKARGKRTVSPPMPGWLLKMAAWTTSPMQHPPLTSSQLTMLLDGMAEDTKESWDLLGIEPRAFEAMSPIEST
ncbi:MAG: complex I NDUFA9 subunit family protein [Polyangiaceae bacterium]